MTHLKSGPLVSWVNKIKLFGVLARKVHSLGFTFRRTSSRNLISSPILGDLKARSLQNSTGFHGLQEQLVFRVDFLWEFGLFRPVMMPFTANVLDSNFKNKPSRRSRGSFPFFTPEFLHVNFHSGVRSPSVDNSFRVPR